MIWRYMPISYLEGYKQILKSVEKKPWPKKPKVVFTSNSHISNDEFKVWLAEKKNKKLKILIGQHGGNLTTTSFSSHFDHEIKICDNYLALGKKNFGIKKIKPFFNFLVKYKKNKIQNKSKCLIILNTYPKYSHAITSSVTSFQYLDYINEQTVLINNLDAKIKKKCILRLHKEEKNYKWHTARRIKRASKSILIDEGNKDIIKLIRDSKICVVTTNGTSYLESLNMNIPTLIFFNKKFDTLNQNVKKDFMVLKKNKIYFDDPIKLSNHLNKIWDNVETWWNSKKIQNVVEKFCINYSRKTNKVEQELASILKRL